MLALDCTYLWYTLVLQTNPTVSEMYATCVRTIFGSLRAPDGTLEYKRWLHHQNFLCFPFQDTEPTEDVVAGQLAQDYDKLSVHFALSDTPTESMHLIILAVFDNVMKITSSNGVQLNYVPATVN